MPWFAIRTTPGTQQPQREFAVETTSRGKGYRIVPSLDPNLSAIEKALKVRGFSYYMPAEKRLQRDRRRPYLFKTKRFALMVGYIFVKDPSSWHELLETPGVAGVVADEYGEPRPITTEEVLQIRSAEGEAEAYFDGQLRKARSDLRKMAKKNPDLKKFVDELDISGTMTIFAVETARAA